LVLLLLPSSCFAVAHLGGAALFGDGQVEPKTNEEHIALINASLKAFCVL
jgi:hypothetical protein